MSKDKSYLSGQLLLAMPAMGDPRFQHAVIYMCAHDAAGAMGLVINHPLPGLQFGTLLSQLIAGAADTVPTPLKTLPVMSGGPVETARGFLLHSKDFCQPNTIEIDDFFSVTGTVDALKAIAAGTAPRKMIFTLGYAGWSAGQLDQEMQQNAWLTAHPTPDLIFQTEPEHLWEKAIATLGISPGMLSGAAGRA